VLVFVLLTVHFVNSAHLYGNNYYSGAPEIIAYRDCGLAAWSQSVSVGK